MLGGGEAGLSQAVTLLGDTRAGGPQPPLGCVNHACLWEGSKAVKAVKAVWEHLAVLRAALCSGVLEIESSLAQVH